MSGRPSTEVLKELSERQQRVERGLQRLIEQSKEPQNYEEWDKRIKAFDELISKANIKQPTETHQPPPPTTPEKLKHNSIEDLLNCPNCRKELIPKTLERVWEERKDENYECLGCGLPVKLEEESCPLCKNRGAKPRRKKR